MSITFNPLQFDPRLSHDGSERDNAAEAVQCCFSRVKDLNGLFIRGSMTVPEAVQTARAVVDNIEQFGYRLVKIDDACPWCKESRIDVFNLNCAGCVHRKTQLGR